MLAFCHKNMADMSVERVHKELSDVHIPCYTNKCHVDRYARLVNAKRPTESNSLLHDKDITDKEQELVENISETEVDDDIPRLGKCILESYLNKPPSLVSIWWCMKWCGCYYDNENKWTFVFVWP